MHSKPILGGPGNDGKGGGMHVLSAFFLLYYEGQFQWKKEILLIYLVVVMLKGWNLPFGG